MYTLSWSATRSRQICSHDHSRETIGVAVIMEKANCKDLRICPLGWRARGFQNRGSTSWFICNRRNGVNLYDLSFITCCVWWLTSMLEAAFASICWGVSLPLLLWLRELLQINSSSISSGYDDFKLFRISFFQVEVTREALMPILAW
jgi:hypothetical protein